MADYPIISDVSNFIVRTLRGKMCPEPIPSANNIQVSSPADQDVDYILGIYLYDIQEASNISTPPFMPVGQVRLQKSPRAYELHYMVFLNGSSQMGLKALDTQKILGRVAQIVNDNSSILPNQLQNWLEVPEPPIVLSQAKLTLEEKVRVWQAISKPYQVSLFYKAGPVFLSSEVVVNTPRVVDAAFGVYIQGSDEKEGR